MSTNVEIICSHLEENLSPVVIVMTNDDLTVYN